MPLGVLQEVLPSVADHHSTYADLISSTLPLGRKVTHSPYFHTAFADAQITTCQEGFRCVSRVKRFGTDHYRDVLMDKAKMAQAGAADVGGKDSDVEEYEYNCPVQGKWVQDRFESGVEADQCREEKDCICIARGTEDSYTTLKDGVEKRHETVEAEMGDGGGKTEKIPIVVIPHYQLRKIPESFNPDNINSDIGEIAEYPAQEWVHGYKTNAAKIQSALDNLKKWMSTVYDTKVQDKPFVCGPPVPGQEATMNEHEVHEASVKIRNFQVLQKDCENMRDTVPMLISPTSEKVSPPGQSFLPKTKHSNCYRMKDGDACVQLNCYTGHDDTVFRDHLREFEARMMACEPEPEDIVSAAGASSPTTTTGAATESATGAAAAGGEAAAAAAGKEVAGTAQQSVGLGGAALAVLAGRNDDLRAGISSKRNSWRSFL